MDGRRSIESGGSAGEKVDPGCARRRTSQFDLSERRLALRRDATISISPAPSYAVSSPSPRVLLRSYTYGRK